METLSPDVEVVSPISGRVVFRGHDDVRLLLGAVRAEPERRAVDQQPAAVLGPQIARRPAVIRRALTA